MDSVLLSERATTLNGLQLMMQDADNAGEQIQAYVSVEMALLIVEIAKMAIDKEEYFPHGKWGTIQNIEGNIREQLATCFRKG